jgi:hypothetical protein
MTVFHAATRETRSASRCSASGFRRMRFENTGERGARRCAAAMLEPLPRMALRATGRGAAQAIRQEPGVCARHSGMSLPARYQCGIKTGIFYRPVEMNGLLQEFAGGFWRRQRDSHSLASSGRESLRGPGSPLAPPERAQSEHWLSGRIRAESRGATASRAGALEARSRRQNERKVSIGLAAGFEPSREARPRLARGPWKPARAARTSEASLAEREGFEPSVEFPLHTLSKRAPSTTRTSLHL